MGGTVRREEEAPEYYLSVVRGLEEIAADEVRERGAPHITTRPGKVFLRWPRAPGELVSLRAAMNVYAFVAERRACPPDAAAERWLRDFAAQLSLGPALARHATLHGRPADPSFRITAVRSGEHEYTSQHVAAWAGDGVRVQTGWKVDLEHFDYEIEVELVRDRVLCGLRLGSSWRERQTKVAFHPASLNTTVAYAMIRLVGASEDDVFLDPACGGGTLLTERAASGPARLILGGDIWPRAIGLSLKNLAAVDARAPLARWDARHLPLPQASVDRVASNLPFGHRVGHGPVVRAFYQSLLPELSRVLRPGGRAALLTSRQRWLGRAIEGSPALHRERTIPIILGGKQAAIFLLVRNE